jgi:hypothetical protein
MSQTGGLCHNIKVRRLTGALYSTIAELSTVGTRAAAVVKIKGRRGRGSKSYLKKTAALKPNIPSATMPINRTKYKASE